MVAPIGLWSHGEITAGFLVLCVPSIPKAFQNSIISKKFSSLVNGLKSGERTENSRRGLPSWYRAKPSKKPRHNEISTMEQCTIITVRSDSESKNSNVEEHDKWGADGTEGFHPPVLHLRTHGLA